VTATLTTADIPSPPPRNGAGGGPRVARRVPEGWVEQPPTRFTLHPSTPTIGAEVRGIDLTDVDDVTFAELHRALLEWKVLFVRDAGLSPDTHHALGLRWGPLEHHPFFKYTALGNSDDRPAGARFEKGAGNGGYENVWPSDVSWREEPSLGSLLRAVEVPEVGGDTLWADMGAAYDCLDDDLKARIDGLTAVHDWWYSFGAAMTPAQRDALRPDFPAVEHPVVRTHPETGRRTLYVNAAFTQHIVGMDRDEGAALLELLYRQAAVPEYQCRFRWTPGAIAIWDNRATQHYASSDYFPQRRVMERITVAGDRPR
jgi:taurine dioxygenase